MVLVLNAKPRRPRRSGEKRCICTCTYIRPKYMNAAPGTAKKSPLVLVVAACLIDQQGRVLLSQRPEGKKDAGDWEFPGGKVNFGETPEQALVRELREELGIEVRAEHCMPLTFTSHAYDENFHLLMPLWQCTSWIGEPCDREGQGLAWVESTKLRDYKLLPADVPMIPAVEAAVKEYASASTAGI